MEPRDHELDSLLDDLRTIEPTETQMARWVKIAKEYIPTRKQVKHPWFLAAAAMLIGFVAGNMTDFNSTDSTGISAKSSFSGATIVKRYTNISYEDATE